MNDRKIGSNYAYFVAEVLIEEILHSSNRSIRWYSNKFGSIRFIIRNFNEKHTSALDQTHSSSLQVIVPCDFTPREATSYIKTTSTGVEAAIHRDLLDYSLDDNPQGQKSIESY